MSAGLAAELCYTDVVRLRSETTLNGIREHWPSAELVDGTSRGGGFMAAFPELTRDGAAIRLLMAVGRPAPQPAESGDRRDLSQTWEWEGAAKTMAAVTHTVTVTEIFGTSFAPADRVRALTAVVRGIGAVTSPAGIWWPASGLATPPEALADRPLTGVVNVRMFNVSDGLLMDTLGLAPLGLPDLQCVFGVLPPGLMAGYLTAAAGHMVAGRVMRAGDTVQGLTPQQVWRVEAGSALAGPERAVLTIRPE